MVDNKNLPSRFHIAGTLLADIDRITDSVDRLGLNTDALYVVGSAALRMSGVCVNERPVKDVDIVVPVQTFLDLHGAKMTRNGVPLSTYRNRGHVLTASSHNNHYGVDIITHYDPSSGMSYEEYDRLVMGKINSTPVSPSGLHYESLQGMLDEYTSPDRARDSKAKNDAALARRYIAMARTIPAQRSTSSR